MEQLIAAYRPGIGEWRPEYDCCAVMAHRSEDLVDLGFPARGLKSLSETFAFMATFDDIMARIIAVEAAMNVQHDLRDVQGVVEDAGQLRTLLEEVPNPLYTASCDVVEGWALARLGRFDDALIQARRGYATARSAGGYFSVHATIMLAEVCLEAKAVKEGLVAIAAAEETFQHSDIRRRRSEVLRVKGELLMLRDSSDLSEPEVLLREAVDVAKKQNAKWLELRATASLARLLRDTNRRDEARAMLAEIYGWFTEGFDTAELKDAKALLDELNG